MCVCGPALPSDVTPPLPSAGSPLHSVRFAPVSDASQPPDLSAPPGCHGALVAPAVAKGRTVCESASFSSFSPGRVFIPLRLPTCGNVTSLLPTSVRLGVHSSSHGAAAVPGALTLLFSSPRSVSTSSAGWNVN